LFLSLRQARTTHDNLLIDQLIVVDSQDRCVDPLTPPIPRLDLSSGLVGFLFSPVGPSDVLVVGAVVVEAAVKDADETVPEGA